MSSIVGRSLIHKQMNNKILAGFSIFNISSVRKQNKSDIILNSDLGEVEIPKISLDEFILKHADKWPNHIASECAVTGRKYTFDDVRAKSTYLNRNLRKKLHLQKGDIIAILLPNVPEFCVITVGALKAGLIITTMNPIYSADEISEQLKDSSAKCIITLVELHGLAKKALQIIRKEIPIITLKTQPNQANPEGSIDLFDFFSKVDYPDVEPSSYDSIAFLPYSSGTTGLPKGVQLTHYNLIANVAQFSSKNMGISRFTNNNEQDILPAVLPMFHIYGLLASNLNSLYHGSKTITLPKFTPDLYLNVLRNHHPDFLFLAPPIINFLTNHPSVKSSDLDSIRTVVSGAAPLGASDEERFLNKAQKDINIFQGYGLTETSPTITINRPDLKIFDSSTGSIGRPVPNTSIKIVDPTSLESLGPNCEGELWVKGPQVMKGYNNKPKETSDSFHDGWFRTGDMGYYNDDNLLFITDRLKELIKVKGFQVPPAQLEEIIRGFPNVEDAAVIGVPHETQGEVPKAFIVEQKGKKVDLKELDEFVAGKVAPYKRLKGGIQVVGNIPKNATGKILRRQLRLQYQKK